MEGIIMDKKFLKAKDIAQLWGITPRRVNQLCTAGFINGAYKEGRASSKDSLFLYLDGNLYYS